MIRQRAFTLLEVLIVLVILGVAAAVALPRMSRGATPSAGAPMAQADVLVGDLRALRDAIAAYAADHAGRYPTGPAELVRLQLTTHTDSRGRVSPHRTAAHRFGPYLAAIPPLPVGPNRGRSEIVILSCPADALSMEVCWPGLPEGGWLYDPATGLVTANTRPEHRDDDGREFRAY